MILGERCGIDDRGPRGQCTHPRGFFFGSISAYHTRSRRLLEWVIHTSTRVIVQATTPLVSAKIKDRTHRRDKVGRQSVRRLQGSECNGPKRAITAAPMPKGGEEQVVSGRLNPLSRSWRGMKADKNQQNDKHSVTIGSRWQEPL